MNTRDNLDNTHADPRAPISPQETRLLLAQGEPYYRFTPAALMDPNGFAGVNGIFRFRADGTSERGLAVLEMNVAGPVVVSPAPTTFLQPGF